MSDRDKSRSVSRSRSKSPASAKSPARSISRSRSPVRSVSRSPRRSPSRSPVRRRSYSRSRSRSPRGRSLSPDRARGGDWQDKLDRLFDRGHVTKSELDDYTLDSLKELSDELADCAIQRFSEANFSRINNKNGFLMGIIRRVKTDGPDRSSGDLESLPRPLRYKLQDLIDDRRIKKDDIDPRMCKALNELPHDLGLEAVDKFAMSNLDNVRSKTGFMMGIIKRIQVETAPPRGYGGRREYDRYDRGDRGYDRYDRGYDRGGYDRYDRGYGRSRDRDRYYR